MAMEISIQSLENKEDYNHFYDGYNVYVGDHRILTLSTYCPVTVSKWLKEVKKLPTNTSTNIHGGAVIVGISAEHEHTVYDKSGLQDVPYDLLQLCVGSHCLLYCLQPTLNMTDSSSLPRALYSFFSDPHVVAVGMDMDSLRKNLETHHQIKFANPPMDLNRMAVKAMDSEAQVLDLGRYRLDQLARAVVGRHMYWNRPGYYEMEMFRLPRYGHVGGRYSNYHTFNSDLLCREKVKFATLDAYLCFLIASKLVERDDTLLLSRSLTPLTTSKKKKKMLKKKKNKYYLNTGKQGKK